MMSVMAVSPIRALASSTNAAELRKIKKPLIEKRRRDRMNKCLEELKELVVNVTPDDGVRNAKMEKADILEKTVLYLKLLHQKLANNNNNNDNKSNNNNRNNTSNNDTNNNKNFNNYNNNCDNIKESLGSSGTKTNDEIGPQRSDLLEDTLRLSRESFKDLPKFFNTNSGSPTNSSYSQQQRKQQFHQLKHLLQQQQLQQQPQQQPQQQQQQPQQQQQSPILIDEVSFERGFGECIESVDSYFEEVDSSQHTSLRSSLRNYLTASASKLDITVTMQDFDNNSNCKSVPLQQQPPEQYSQQTHQPPSRVFPIVATNALKTITNKAYQKSLNMKNSSVDKDDTNDSSDHENCGSSRKRTEVSRKSCFIDRNLKSEVESEVPLKRFKSESPSNTHKTENISAFHAQSLSLHETVVNCQKDTQKPFKATQEANTAKNFHSFGAVAGRKDLANNIYLNHPHHQTTYRAKDACKGDLNTFYRNNKSLSSLAFWRPWSGLIS